MLETVNFRGAQIPRFETEILREIEEHLYSKFTFKNKLEWSTIAGFTIENPYTRFGKVVVNDVEGIFDLHHANDLWGTYQMFYPYSAKDDLSKIPDLNDYF